MKKNKTWKDYCEKIDINRSTAHRWLKVFETSLQMHRGEPPPLPETNIKIDIKHGDFRELIKGIPDDSHIPDKSDCGYFLASTGIGF